jgi:transcriptional regulator with XRE-family HTH domain
MPTWTAIRTHYATLLRASGLSQQEVARRGGLPRNNGISRLLANTKRGPSVDTLMKAVAGLGLSLEEFFAGVEGSQPGTRSLSARLEAVETAVATLLPRTVGVIELQPRRRHGTWTREIILISATGETIGTFTISDDHRDPIARPDDDLDRRITAIVRATLDPIINSTARKMDEAIGALRDADLDPPRTLSAGRRSVRRPAAPPRPPHVKDMLKEDAS